jgi:hypothetical protein
MGDLFNANTLVPGVLVFFGSIALLGMSIVLIAFVVDVIAYLRNK